MQGMGGWGGTQGAQTAVAHGGMCAGRKTERGQVGVGLRFAGLWLLEVLLTFHWLGSDRTGFGPRLHNRDRNA